MLPGISSTSISYGLTRRYSYTGTWSNSDAVAVADITWKWRRLG
jgi:hypothetical protein